MNANKEIRTVTCPACSQTNPFDSVSVIEEGTTNLKELFAGTINKVNCSFCSTKFLVEIPIIYRDNPKNFLIYNKALGKDEALTGLLDLMDELYHRVYEDLDRKDKPTCRLTLSRKDLIEKIAIHQQGYDDRLIEYIKYQLFGHSKKGLDSNRMELLFDFSNTNQESICFLAFDLKTGNPLYSLNFQNEDYRKLENYFLSSSEMEKKLNQLFKKYYVHVGNLLG